ncbi:flocculation-associated PEP-CTERM protein PepA [Methylicorpusculum sp.]|nr:flocculation-associated PEP-CTERM protein PepA [Methylicorpusculum sp.]MDP3528918.1 flocculation-associated PEP-CTERM protein PepA [Methylicorpusculum sp.]
MKLLNTKNLAALSLTAAMGMASTSAMALAFPDFQVDEGSVPGGTVANVFTADKITGNYVEIATFDPAGTFDVSIQWQAGQFVANDGTLPVVTQLGSFGPGGYGLYALFQGSGTFATVGSVTTFNFASGSLGLYLDPSQNTTFTAPATGNVAWTTGNTGDDILIGTGSILSGAGTLNPTLSTCVPGAGINCGSFGTTSSFELTNAGKLYFISPDPFHNLVFNSGQLNSFVPVGTQEINGSMDAIFGQRTVPEPTTVALMGLGLLGLGLRRRKA